MQREMSISHGCGTHSLQDGLDTEPNDIPFSFFLHRFSEYNFKRLH